MEIEMGDINESSDKPLKMKHKRIKKKVVEGLYHHSVEGRLSNSHKYEIINNWLNILEEKPESRDDFLKGLKKLFGLEEKVKTPSEVQTHLTVPLKVDPKLGILLELKEDEVLTRGAVVKKIFDKLKNVRTEHKLLDVANSPFKGLLGEEPVSYSELYKLVGPYVSKA